MGTLRAFFFLIAVALATPAMATPQSVNVTGLWLKPDELGWGLYIDHQGDTLFATLFVYGADGQPRWYSASALVGNGTWSGPLYESTGTPYDLPFSAASVNRRQVGDMSFEVAGSAANLSYSVDGVRVTKPVQPFTWKFNEIAGSYRAAIVTASTGAVEDVTADIDLNTGLGTYRMITNSQAGVSCTYSGRANAYNMEVRLGGIYTCSDGSNGPAEFSIDPTTNGFVSKGPRAGTLIAAVRSGNENYVGNGWMNDLYIVNGESGWGLNLVGQGDTLFGTMFVYDATQRSKWYSASALTLSGGLNDRYWPGRYTGDLYESTGPSFASGSFNANTVTRRKVGTMTVEFSGPATAGVTYTIDGKSFGPKYLMPFAMRANSLTGSYAGRYWHPASGTSDDLQITITDGAHFDMRSVNTAGRSCFYDAKSRGQFGQRLVVSGLYTCSDGTNGSYVFENTEVFSAGFTAQLSIDNRLVGHLAAARTSF
jgi:hypothetical protein